MTVSSHFITGMANKNAIAPCEDYALDSLRSPSSLYSPAEYATVSDGCSGGDRTDIGARLMCATAMSLLSKYHGPRPENNYLSNLSTLLENNGFSGCTPQQNTLLQSNILTSMDMLSTLGGLIYFPKTDTTEPELYFHLYGDGVIAVAFKDGSIAFTEITCKYNMPYYPIYSTSLLYDEDMATKNVQYIKCTQNHIEHNFSSLSANGYHQCIYGANLHHVDYVIICTDGIASSQNENTTFVDIIPQLFKSKGRHTNVPRRALNKMDINNTHNFYDDVAFAAWMNPQ